jgi:hypothetical protein
MSKLSEDMIRDTSTFDLRNTFIDNKSMIKELNDDNGMMKAILSERVQIGGVEDENGHKRLYLTGEGEQGVVEVQKRIRTSINDSKAKKLFDEKGLTDEVLIMQPVFDEKKIETLYNAGKITPKELLSIYDEKESFALYVK